jgi:hypothetical protein
MGSLPEKAWKSCFVETATFGYFGPNVKVSFTLSVCSSLLSGAVFNTVHALMQARRCFFVWRALGSSLVFGSRRKAQLGGLHAFESLTRVCFVLSRTIALRMHACNRCGHMPRC